MTTALPMKPIVSTSLGLSISNHTVMLNSLVISRKHAQLENLMGEKLDLQCTTHFCRQRKSPINFATQPPLFSEKSCEKVGLVGRCLSATLVENQACAPVFESSTAALAHKLHNPGQPQQLSIDWQSKTSRNPQ